MKTKTRNLLPKTAQQITNGSVHSQRVRCGKSNCKCSKGDTHTAYYFFTRIEGKLTKFYIRKSEVKTFSRLVKQARLRREQERINRNISNDLLSKFRSLLSDNSKDIQQARGELSK